MFKQIGVLVLFAIICAFSLELGEIRNSGRAQPYLPRRGCRRPTADADELRRCRTTDRAALRSGRLLLSQLPPPIQVHSCDVVSRRGARRSRGAEDTDH